MDHTYIQANRGADLDRVIKHTVYEMTNSDPTGYAVRRRQMYFCASNIPLLQHDHGMDKSEIRCGTFHFDLVAA